MTIRAEVSEKMARIARACGAPATWDELRKDLLSAGAAPEEADEHIAQQKAQRHAN